MENSGKLSKHYLWDSGLGTRDSLILSLPIRRFSSCQLGSLVNWQIGELATRLTRQKARKGQSMVEFTFCMIVVFFMIYGLAKIFQWTGVDPVKRMEAHTKLLRQGGWVSPHQQMSPNFYTPVSFEAVWSESP